MGIALGIAALRFTWRRKSRMHSFLTQLGWLIIVAGLFLWGLVDSADWGIAIGTILFICVALIALTFNAWSAFRHLETRPKSAARTNEPQRFNDTPPRVYARHLFTFFLAAPIGGGVAIVMTLAVFDLLKSFGIETANGIVTMFFLTPLLWTAVATWMVIDTTIAKKTTLLCCCATLSALHLVW